MATPQKPCQRTPEEQIGYLLKRLMHQFRHLVDERLRRSSDVLPISSRSTSCSRSRVLPVRKARRLLVTRRRSGPLRRLERKAASNDDPIPITAVLTAGTCCQRAERLNAARASGAP
jgi:hypothetical protein